MLKPTKAHKECIDDNKNIYSIRIGKKVPTDSVSLAYFYNLGKNSGSKNILAVDSPRNSVDHIELADQRKVTDLPYKNESIFPKYLDYKDDEGYTGTLYQTKIEWIANVKENSKFALVQKSYENISSQTVPSSIEHSEGQLKGTLYIKDEVYTPTSWEEKNIEVPVTKTFVRSITAVGLPTASYNFPSSYAIDDIYGYKGNIPLIQSSISYTAVDNDSDVKNVIMTREYEDGQSIPDTLDYTYGGRTYKIPITNKEEVGTNLKHYGTCRYWGYSSTGLYGTKDRKYAATSYGGKGYFGTDKYPAQIANRYGHFPTDSIFDYKTFTVKSAYTGWKEYKKGTNNVTFFYIDETITKVNNNQYILKDPYTTYWNKDIVSNKSGHPNDLKDGISWNYDIAKASYYGTPNSLQHGGCLWVSQYLAKEDVWPPKGYENDPIYRGDQHMTLVTDSAVYQNGNKYTSGQVKLEGKAYNVSSLIKINNYPKNKVIMTDAIVKRNCLFSAVTRCTTALSYPGNQQYSRMTIQFYSSKTKKTKVTYSANIVIPTGKTYTASANYMGDLSIKYTEKESFPIRWNCFASYEGIIRNSYYTYDGIATYRGIALRRKVVGNINPLGLEEKVMYCNSDGYLLSNLDDENSKVVDGQSFMITDVHHGVTPLFYSYCLSNYIYDLDGPDASGMYSGNSIKLVDENGIELKKPYLYKIKLVATKYKNLYKGYVFTSFNTYTNKNIYCVYNSCNVKNDVVDMESFKSGDKELIFVQEAYQANKDYVVEKLDEYRKGKIRFFNKNLILDGRRKIPVTYLVKTTDNKFVSNPIHANILNKQYAFKSELDEFDGNNHIISPLYGSEYLTARDILVRDLGIEYAQLNDKQFTVEFFNSATSSSNYKKVYLYTNQDGTGHVIGLTSEETGFLNSTTNQYDKIYDFNSLHKIHNNFIFPGFTVVNKDVKTIKLQSPNNNNLLEAWYPKIKFGNFSQTLEQYNSKVKVTYSIPEFTRQRFNSVNGEPYKYVENEIANVISENEIKLSMTPLFIKTSDEGKPTNILLYRTNSYGNNEPLTIKSWSYMEGIITVEEYLSETDIVYVSYEYEEEYYIYRGYYDNDEFIDLNINPSIYFDYLDTTEIPYKRKKTIELFDKTIYFFIKPKRIENLTTNEVLVDNDYVIYHKFDNTNPDNEHDLLIGSLLIRHNTSLTSTVLIDTRQIGGGLIDTISDRLRKELEPESDYYFDIGFYDGEMYPENSTVIIRFNKSLLKEYNGKFTKGYIDSVIEKWLPYGVNCMVEYIDVVIDEDNPNNNLSIE